MAANEGAGSASRFSNGLPANATIEDKRAFAIHCAINYEKQNWHNDSLSEYFADDFRDFTVEDFTNIDTATRRNLRDLLRSRGVFVPKGRNIVIAQALHQVVQDDIPWPEDDTEKPINQASAMSPGKRNEPFALENRTQDRRDDGDTTETDNNSQSKHDRQPPRNGNMANLFKAYSNDSDKYSGATTDNFERKFMLFLERCDQAAIPNDDRHRAFSIMLIGNARQYYFDNLKSESLDLSSLEKAIKMRFQTPERTRALLREWEMVTLNSIIASNTSKSPTECLELLIEKLSDIQTSLPKEYRSEIILRNKLLNAVRDVESCRLAYHKPAETVQGVISDLHASIAAMKNSDSSSPEPSAHLVDRRYIRNGDDRNRGDPSRQKKCFVCKRPGCWSTNHSSKERLKAYRNSKILRQFITSLSPETESDEEEQETADALDDVIAHIIEIGQNDKHDITEDDGSSFSHIASIDDKDESASFSAQLSDSIMTHALTTRVPQSRFGGNFNGIMIDTGAARGSSAGKAQYQAYCSKTGRQVNINESRAARCHFGIGSAVSLGTASITFPIGSFWVSFDAHIVDADTPILMSIDDMDRLGVYLNNLENVLVHSKTGSKVPITRVRGHPFVQWNSFSSCHLTEIELRRLHRRFGHPSTEKLLNILHRAEIADIGPNTRKILSNIERTCGPCQTYAQRPRRFKFTLRDDKEFNHTIYADIFYIDKKPILHVVDEATYFQSAKWLENMEAETLWKALRGCWIDVYLGPPDFIAHDAGKNFMAAAFQSNSDMLHIRTKAIPVEAAHSMSIVERYHTPIRRAYKIICKEAPDLNKETALQMAVKAINDSVGPEGLVPTLLVFGALPRLGLPSDPPTPSTFKRAIALRKATATMSKHFSSRQVKDALKTRNGPDVTDIHKTPIGAPVLVYRPKTDKWEGPYSILEINGEDIIVLLPKGPTKFRSTVVKPYLTPSHEKNPTPTIHITSFSQLSSDFDTTDSYKSNISDTQIDTTQFSASRNIEFNGLIERGVFTLVPESMANGLRIYGSRFVDQVKNEGKPSAYNKSRLVVQAYGDHNHGLLTHAPTVQRVSQRLLLIICAMDNNLTLFTRDISQAYVQSETRTQRPIFVRPPSQLNIPRGTVLRVERPLYGIPEAGLHWFRTYHNHHKKKLALRPSIHDPCFLYTPNGMSVDSKSPKIPRGFTCLQTDDTVSAANNEFIAREAKFSNAFDAKEPTFLREGKTISFNGADISLKQSVISINQNQHISRLSPISSKQADKSEFVTQRARGAYIAAVCRPDLTFGFSHASQIITPNVDAINQLNKSIKQAQANSDMYLKFVPLNNDSLRLVTFADASFATNADMSSQLGFVIALADKFNRANILHYSSVKSKRVTRSVLASELFAAVLAFDHASTIRLALNKIFGRLIPHILYTDSKSLYDSLVGINSTTEKRLLIDLCMLRQAYELRELTEVIWIPSSQNPSDAMTKSNASGALERLIRTNRLEVDAKSWVERPDKTLSMTYTGAGNKNKNN